MKRNRAVQEAERIVAAIRRNSDDIHFDAIDWDTFHLRSRTLWAEAEADPGIKSMVLGLLRNDPNWQTPEEGSMSKRKIDETMTEARNARAKKAREAAPETDANETATETVGVPVPARAKGRKPKETPATQEPAPKEKEPREDLVVFAFRLTAADRDLIHKAAGAAKASRYARTLLVAASKGDVKLVSEITAAIRDELNITS